MPERPKNTLVEEISPRKRLVFWPFQSFINTILWFGSNPITIREFIRYSRSYRFWALMALLLIVGSAILCMVWSYNQFEDPIVPVGRRLFYSLIAAELAVIVLLLPGIVSHSLIAEREQDTYPLLLTTPLSPGRIIGGKLVSTLGVMVLLIVSTFPLIGICMARGGVSPFEMIAGSFYLIFFCFVVASFSIYHALNAKTTLNAILLTHVTLFLALIVGGATLAFWLGILYSFLGIFAKLASTNNPAFGNLQNYVPYIWIWNLIIMGTLLSLWFTFWLLRSSRSRLRFVEPEIRSSWEMERSRLFYLQQKADPNDDQNQSRSWWDFKDGLNPFYIRERFAYAVTSSLSGVSSWYIVILFCHVLFLLTPLSEGRWAAILTLLAIGQMVPAYAGPLFAREKERDTWDLALTTVCQTQGILHGKIKGALSQCLPRAGALFGLPFITAFFLVFLIQWISPTVKYMISLPQFLFYGGILFVQLIFLLLATSFFSLRLPRAGQSITAGYAITLIIMAWPYVLGLVVQRFQIPIDSEYLFSLSPFFMIYTIPAINDSQSATNHYFFFFSGHVALYSIASFLFYISSILSLKRLR